ncbi:MAG: hypothetical protein ACOC1U_06385 [Spirochaetota bacterium]
MTLAARNTILTVGVVLTTALTIGYAVAGWAIFFGPWARVPFEVPEVQRWVSFAWPVRPENAFRSLAAAGFLGVLATVLGAVSLRLFRRVSSAEIYFMTLFVLSLAAETIRMGAPLLHIFEVPVFWGLALTRVVIFGRLMGALALFTAGIYSAGADYPRIGSVTLLLATLSFLIVYFIPVDTGRMHATFLHVIGGREQIDLMLLFLSLATIVNYLIGWFRGHRERGGAVALAVVVVVIGRQLVLHIPSLVPLVAGLTLLVLGSVSFVLVNRSYYIWY